MKYFLSLVFVLLLLPSLTYAHEEETTTPTPITEPTITQNIKEEQAKLPDTRRGNKAQILEEKKDIREDIKTLKKTARDTFKEKLTTFKDKVKAERVDRIGSLFTTINTNRTAEMGKRLDTMATILTKLTTKLTDLDKEGKDTTAAKSAVTDAQTALQTARQAVDTQSKKEYAITISSETGVKTDISSTKQTLFTDLKMVNEQVHTVREKVSAAITQTKLLLPNSSDGK